MSDCELRIVYKCFRFKSKQQLVEIIYITLLRNHVIQLSYVHLRQLIRLYPDRNKLVAIFYC